MRTLILSFPEWNHDVVTGHNNKFDAIVSELDHITAHFEVDNHNSFLFPVRGPARYFGGEDALVQHVYTVITSLFPDLVCGIGVGDSRFVARLASAQSCHSRAPVVVASRDTHDLLRVLPVQVLFEYTDIAADVVAVFQHLGLHTLGHVVDVGETPLIDRFGIVGQHVFALATGQDTELFIPSIGHKPVVKVSDLDNMAHHGLSDAMNDSSIVVAMTQTSIDEFVQEVSFQGLQCLRLRISCETDHGEHNERIWCDTRGFDGKSITERLVWQLRHWLGDANNEEHPTSYISAVVFESLECRSIASDAVTLWDVRSDNTERVVRALARAVVADEHAQITVPVHKGGRDVSTFGAINMSQVDLHNDDDRRSVQENEWNGSVPTPRPITLCHPEVPVVLRDALSRAVVVTGRHDLSSDPTHVCFADGMSWNVVAWAGPWPVEERWWDPQRWRRHARLQVVASSGESTAAWLLSVESRQWKIIASYQ
jgi:protein ImuB